MSTKKSIILITLLFTAPLVQAQSGSTHPIFTNDWLIRVGAQEAEADVKVGLANEELGAIPVIDFNALGVDPKFTSGWLDVVWQGPERWSWAFNYFQSKADGQVLTTSDTEFGDLVIPAGTGLETDFETSFYLLNGFYDFYQAPDTAAGVGFGVYALDLEATIQTIVGGQPTGEFESADVLAPLPTLSLYYKHAFNEKWAIMADLNYFGLTIDDFDGNVFAARANVDYWFNDRWALGAGLSFVDIDLTVEDEPFDKLFDVQYDSYFLYLTYGF